jgi:hypothetical protein
MSRGSENQRLGSWASVTSVIAHGSFVPIVVKNTWSASRSRGPSHFVASTRSA